jgi:hypothetical protein
MIPKKYQFPEKSQKMWLMEKPAKMKKCNLKWPKFFVYARTNGPQMGPLKGPFFKLISPGRKKIGPKAPIQ